MIYMPTAPLKCLNVYKTQKWGESKLSALFSFVFGHAQLSVAPEYTGKISCVSNVFLYTRFLSHIPIGEMNHDLKYAVQYIQRFFEIIGGL